MKYITALFLILLFGCTRQSDGVGQGDTDTTTLITNNFDFIIKDGQIGNLRTGEQLTGVLEKLKTLTVVRDSVPECEGCGI